MKRLSLLAYCLSALLVVPKHAKADLLGSSVSGTLSSGNLAILVATPYTSPQVIGPGVEFSGVLNATGTNLLVFTVATDFSATGFTVTIAGKTPNSGVRAFSDLFSLVFSDTAFTSASLLTSYGCTSAICSTTPGNGLTSATFSGNTLSLSFDQVIDTQVYTFATPAAGTPASVTPEPGSITLLSTGLIGLAGLLRSRRRWTGLPS